MKIATMTLYSSLLGFFFLSFLYSYLNSIDLFVCLLLRMQKLTFNFQYWFSDTVNFCLLQLVFMVFTGESWGFLGSRRFLLELDLHSDAVNGLDFSLIDMVFTTFWSIFCDFVLSNWYLRTLNC